MAALAISSSSATVRIGCKKSAFVSNASTSVRSEFAGLRRMDSMFDMVSSHCLFAQIQRNVQAVGNGCHGVVTTEGTGKFFVGGNGKCNEEKQEAENTHLSGLRQDEDSNEDWWQRDWGLLNRHYFVDECLTFEAADEVNQQELNPSRRRRCLKLHSSKTSSEITASFSLFLKTIAGSSLCMQVQGSHSVSELKTQIHQATGIPPRFQQLIFEGRQLGDGSLLRDYGNLKDATISLTSRLRGGAPSVTHPSS